MKVDLQKREPLRIFDYTVTKDWDFEKLAEYERNIADMIRFAERRGQPLTIEYIDDDLNVVKTLEFEGNEEKALEYEKEIKKLINLSKGETGWEK